MSLFVTFEGFEGSGKTTQIKRAGDFLREKNIPFIFTCEPGGTELGLKLRDLLLNGLSLSIADKAELLLFLADRAQHVNEVIRPALKNRTVVLCDRYDDATMAYQGFGRGIDSEAIRYMNDFASDSLRPDVTFLFDIPVEVGISRINARAVKCGASASTDRFETEKELFHKKVREGYLTLAGQNPERFFVIDGTGDMDDISHEVCRVLEDKLFR